MIERIKGVLREKNRPFVVVEINNGISYELQLPNTCFTELPANGEKITLFTHFSVREDAQTLYGFTSKAQRLLFRELIKTSGLGAKLALAILSGMSTTQFIEAIDQKAIAALIHLPGVGRKTAERLLVEMRDRLNRAEVRQALMPATVATISTSTQQPSTLQTQEKLPIADAVTALIALGYKAQEANQLVARVTQPNMDSEALIRAALRLVMDGRRGSRL